MEFEKHDHKCHAYLRQDTSLKVTTWQRRTQSMWCTPQAHGDGAVSNVVCCQSLTSKSLVAPLYIIVSPII